MKKWYLSKTLWVNVLSLAGIGLQAITGKEALPPEAQLALLGAINVVLRIVTNQPIAWVFLLLLPLYATGCFSTTAKYYFKERVDKGIVLEGAWQDTGINIKMPGDPLTAGSLNLGRRVGWGVLVAQPLDQDDAMLYEHTEGLKAGPDAFGATLESQTTVRNDKQKYLGPERGGTQ